MQFLLRLLFVLSVSVAALGASAQILVTGGADPLDADSVKRDFSNQPYFGLYKDNYFIFGPLGRPEGYQG